MNQVNAIQTAVTRMLISGCSVEQLSFEGPDPNQNAAYFVNPNSPTDFHCHLYRSEGGAVPYVLLKPEWIFDINSGGLDYWITGSETIHNVGTTCANSECSELSLNIWNIEKRVCEALNELSGERALNTNIPSDYIGGDAFTGDFGDPPVASFTNPLLMGKLAACYHDTANGYVYNSVLIAR